MKIDATLKKEIQRANGTGSREDKFATLRKIIAVKKEFSTPEVMRTFDTAFKNHERLSPAVGTPTERTSL